MPNRFLDTNYYKSPFVRGLTGKLKSLYSFIICDCDGSGIWNMDMQAASMYIGFEVTTREFEEFFVANGKAINLGSGKFFFPDFIEHQYPGGLQANNKAHKNFIFVLKKYKLIDENCKLLRIEAPLEDAFKASQVMSSNGIGKGNGLSKGGAGEMWDSVKGRWFGDFRYKEKICMDKKIEVLVIEQRMNEFVSELELKEDYKDIAALKKHFINWNNKRYNGKSNKPISNSNVGKSIEFDKP
jgi:hypothetical protein